jgi:16S rRNA (cytidine1402-2'-O)-methyltransferase
MPILTNSNGTLYLVSTPIGNLEDITLRAIQTLKNVDLIVCEDTRVTGFLLKHYGIEKKLISYNNFNEGKKTNSIITDLLSGKNIALVSDAGTPLIADPGYILVQTCQENNIKVVPIPGACSLIVALSISGFPTNNFVFLGFLDKSSKKRKDLFTTYKPFETTIVCFETPHRIKDTLEDILEVFGENVQVAIARELTKIYEEVKKLPILDLIKFYENNKPLGEMVVLIRNIPSYEIAHDHLEGLIKQHVETMAESGIKTTEAAKQIAKKYKLDKNEVYKLIIEAQGK